MSELNSLIKCQKNLFINAIYLYQISVEIIFFFLISANKLSKVYLYYLFRFFLTSSTLMS